MAHLQAYKACKTSQRWPSAHTPTQVPASYICVSTSCTQINIFTSFCSINVQTSANVRENASLVKVWRLGHRCKKSWVRFPGLPQDFEMEMFGPLSKCHWHRQTEQNKTGFVEGRGMH